MNISDKLWSSWLFLGYIYQPYFAFFISLSLLYCFFQHHRFSYDSKNKLAICASKKVVSQTKACLTLLESRRIIDIIIIILYMCRSNLCLELVRPGSFHYSSCPCSTFIWSPFAWGFASVSSDQKCMINRYVIENDGFRLTMRISWWMMICLACNEEHTWIV